MADYLLQDPIEPDTINNPLDRIGISLSDLEDQVADNFDINDNSLGFRTLSPSSGGQAVDNHRRLGSFTRLTSCEKYINRILEESYRLVGQGRPGNLLQNFLSRMDRHGIALVPPNTMNYGFTFITRPRLNLTTGNLRQSPYFASLMTKDKNSVPFMIRVALDTVLNKAESLVVPNKSSTKDACDFAEINELSNAAAQSSLIDVNNPFLVPLCNGLKGISGWPDFTLETETTEGDFHSGDFTYIKGSDMLNRSTELSLEFRDIQGGIIIAMVYYWILYIAHQAKGLTLAYPDDIYEQRLNYTVSIYRFITDPTRRYVLWWSKATGCIPKSVPIGALFNINQGEVSISSAANYSIPFVANHIEYNHPGILIDFNTLMERYNPQLSPTKLSSNNSSMVEIPVYSNGQLSADIRRLNFMALPYLVPNTQGIELKWYTSQRYCDSAEEFAAIKQLASGNMSDNSLQTLTDQEFDKLYQEVVAEQSEELQKAMSLFRTEQDI